MTGHNDKQRITKSSHILLHHQLIILVQRKFELIFVYKKFRDLTHSNKSRVNSLTILDNLDLSEIWL